MNFKENNFERLTYDTYQQLKLLIETEKKTIMFKPLTLTITFKD